MEFFEKLYDEHENAKVRFIGFTTESTRYDFGIIYTNMFFGKPLVVCMQTGRSTLLDPATILWRFLVVRQRYSGVKARCPMPH
jgi:hypothetical protein